MKKIHNIQQSVYLYEYFCQIILKIELKYISFNTLQLKYKIAMAININIMVYDIILVCDKLYNK